MCVRNSNERPRRWNQTAFDFPALLSWLLLGLPVHRVEGMGRGGGRGGRRRPEESLAGGSCDLGVTLKSLNLLGFGFLLGEEGARE